MLLPGTFGLTMLLAALTALGPLSVDMYLPSLPEIGVALDAPTARVQLTVSSYFIGFACGQIIYGPLSDRYGRRPALLGGLVLYAAATVVCAATPSVDTLIAARFIQAVGGSGAIVMARAVVRDIYTGARAGRELSLMGSISGFAPIAAPILGGVLQTAFGWRASFIAMSAAAVIALALVARLLPETLRKRTTEPFSLAFMLRSYAVVLRHSGFLAYLGILTATYAGLFAWISGGSVVLQGVYGLSALAFGFIFAVGAAGYVIGATVASRLVLRLGLERVMGFGVVGLALGGLIMAAVVAANITNAIWLMIGVAVYLGGIGLSMPQAMAGALSPFGERAGTASSLLGFVQQTIAALVAAAIGFYLGKSAWPLAAGVLAMGCLAFLLWAFTRGARAHEH